MFTRMLFITIALGLATTVAGAPLPSGNKNGDAPAFSAQVRSIDDLLPTIKTAARNVLPPFLYAEFEREALSKLDPNMLPGVDVKRPWAAYGRFGLGLLENRFDDSSLIVLVPISDEKKFLDFLNGLDLKLDKTGELYTFPIPDAPVSGSLRFYKEYAYIGVDPDKLDTRKLLHPADVIDSNEKAAGVVRLRIDHVPEKLRTTILGAFKQGIDRELGRGVPKNAEPFIVDFSRTAERWSRNLFLDGKEIVLRADLDPHIGSIKLETTFEAVNGTDVARFIKGIKPNTNAMADLVTADSAAHAVVSLPFFAEDIRRLVGELLTHGSNEVGKEMRANEPKEIVALKDELFAVLKKTVDSGLADGVACLRGPDKKGQYTAVGGVTLKDAGKLEAAFKAALKVAPNKEAQDRLKVDAFQIGNTNVHEIKTGELLPEEAIKIFGKSSVYFAVTPDACYITFGADGKQAISDLLSKKRTPKPMPMAAFDVSGKRLMAMVKTSGEPLEGTFGELYARFAEIDRIRLLGLEVQGGDKLTLRAEMDLWTMMGGMAVPFRVGGNAAPPMVIQKKVEIEVKEEKK